MTHRGGFNHSFIQKYAPLRMKGMKPPSIGFGGSSSGTPIGLSARNFMSNPVQGSTTTPMSRNVTEPALSETSDASELLSSSLDNIATWCQFQESRNFKLQEQLKTYVEEIAELKSNLQSSSTMIDQLHSTNQTLKEAQKCLEHELEAIHEIYSEVKNNLTAAALTVEETRKDRESWLSNFENIHHSRYENLMKNLQKETEKSVKQSDSLVYNLRTDNEELKRKISDVEFECNNLKEQLKVIKSELDDKIKENAAISEEQSKGELIHLKNNFDKFLDERTAEVYKEFQQEDIKKQTMIQEFDALQQKWESLQSEYEKATFQLNELKELDNKEPRDKFKVEIECFKSQIEQLNQVNKEIEKETFKLRAQLASTCLLNESNEEIKMSMQTLSEQYAELQERQSTLEKQYNSTNEALIECMSQRDGLEIRIKECTTKLEFETLEKAKLESRVEQLTQEMTIIKESVDTKQNKIDELTGQLSDIKEHNQHLEAQLNEKLQDLENVNKQDENLRQSMMDLEKEVAELKCELMAKTAELQYKDKKMEAAEKSLNELLQQQSENSKLTLDETVQPADTDASKSKTKTEIEKLKSCLNLKNLELESLNQLLLDAQQKVSAAENRIAELELQNAIPSLHLKPDRDKENSSGTKAESSSVSVETVSTAEDLDKEKSQPKLHSILKSSREGSSITAKIEDPVINPVPQLDTLALLQRAKAIAMAENLKRKSRESNTWLNMKPPSPSPCVFPTRTLEKRRRNDDTQSSQSKWYLRENVNESPVIRNKSGIVTTRIHGSEPPVDLDMEQMDDFNSDSD